MKNIIFYLIIIIIVLSGLTYIFYYLNKQHKADAQRWEKNTIGIQQNVSTLNYTIKDLKKYIDSKNDSILKKVNIKPKIVTQITNNYTIYQDTTISVILPSFEQKTGTYPFIDKQGCFEFSGFIEMNDTIPELNVENRVFNSDFTEIEHWEKDTIHFLGLKAAKFWQRKRKSSTIIDGCTGRQIIKKINVK